ncbi:IS3 family transposase [Acinetobacter baretiae]|uniref:IS3 family transposase n=1 Tax=Acinetobacter baretiae TaxID=2605383 RepID=UPI0039A6257F
MAKYSQEFKHKVVQAYLSGIGGYITVSQHFSVRHSLVEKWVEKYQKHGLDGLAVQSSKTAFSIEFKINAVQMILEGMSFQEARRQLNLSDPSLLSRWFQQYQEHGIDGLKPKLKGRPKYMLNPSKENQDKTPNELLEELEYLRAENAYLKKLRALRLEQEAKETAEQQKARLISGLRHSYKLKYLLRASNMARSTYFYHEHRLNFDDKYSDLKQQIKAIYHQHKGRYGYRRITLALRNMEMKINHKCVQRLMQIMSLKSRVRRAKYRSYKGQVGKIANNVLQRSFHADRPNQKWATDVTEFNVGGEKLYLSPIIDLFNGEIIAYQTKRRPQYDLVKDMLDKALNKLTSKDEVVLHSDQGWQYQMYRYQQQLKQCGITQSMSRKGNCLDNAVIESFFGILKSECFYGKKFNSVEELEKTVKEYIHYYNHDRIKVKLKGLSPVEYRIQSLKKCN